MNVRLLTDPAYNLVEPERKRPMFKLEFDTDNAAFEHRTASETARILRNVAKQIENGFQGGKVFDLNGNSVGRFELNGD